ncbi:uracil-DNA glycosylase [Haloparvum sedimenti]|uniref:uracil-DNA glycosylase n=1 Tax=Haloparvum sedimenti TaxID=1678448 RepID=UPI00071E710A|nr:uracil-DNA glycosylase [Haloparvum sedimenti]
MDAHQREFANPFGMDADCRNCEALCETREHVVHGYGDVGGEFVVVGEAPTAGADAAGVPFVGDAVGERVLSAFAELGFVRSGPGVEGADGPGVEGSDASAGVEPDVQNVFFTYLTRCRHPDRAPADDEVLACEPFLNAEIRMINPQIIVPVGQRALEELAVEYTTRRPESFDAAAEHATTVRGRGFELVPMADPETLTDDDVAAFVEHMQDNVLSRDYRQTKGRQSR